MELFRSKPFRLENERANNPSQAVAQSALAKTRRLGVFEAPGVSPVYCGERGRESGLSYARQRGGYARCEIQVHDDEWNVAEVIGNEDSRPLV